MFCVGCKTEKGRTLTAMVVYRDLVNQRLEVLLERKYVQDRKSRKTQQTSHQVLINATADQHASVRFYLYL